MVGAIYPKVIGTAFALTAVVLGWKNNNQFAGRSSMVKLDFESIFNGLRLPLMVMNTDFEIVAINEAYLDLTQRTRKSLVGMNVFRAFPAAGESRRLLQTSLERVRDEGIVEVLPALHYSIAGKPGFEERAWSCTNLPILDQEGKVAFLLKNTRHITGEAFAVRKMHTRSRIKPEGKVDEYFLDFVCQPIKDANGSIDGIVIEGSDMTENVGVEQWQSLLIRELNHRVRNTLATVQGIMNTTAKSSATIEEFQEGFAGRIASLAKAHAVMTEELEQSVSFLLLLNQELGPYSDDRGSRFRLSGPCVDLPSQIAVPVGMAIHELTINAIKHGALAREKGHIEVDWGLIDKGGAQALWCEWRECDGPIVMPPSRQGFGSMLLDRVLSQQIGAEVKTDFCPEGFRLRMIIPLQLKC